ncbi:MAG TPA: glycosyltransferase [Candidatus Paceibacterota bacterium]|jgi:glycosyltransferase involved in cell wall biosynthesis|nr:glycosyltransferase [Candidatus Paceibacterota bacterium]
MDTPPLVSIIVTARNVEKYVSDLYKGLRSQTEQRWEAIVVDDGSTDGTADRFEALQREDPRIHLYRENHIGRIPALHRALDNATGAYIAIHDADDISCAQRIEKQVHFLEHHPKVGMVGSFASVIDASGTPTGNVITAPTTHRDIRRVIIRYNPFVHSSVMFRKEALFTNGVSPYSQRFIPGFEWEVYVHVMKKWEVANIPECLVSYRIHETNLTKSRSAIKRLLNTTRARWYVFKTLKLPWYHFPFIFSGVRDILHC